MPLTLLPLLPSSLQLSALPSSLQHTGRPADKLSFYKGCLKLDGSLVLSRRVPQPVVQSAASAGTRAARAGSNADQSAGGGRKGRGSSKSPAVGPRSPYEAKQPRRGMCVFLRSHFLRFCLMHALMLSCILAFSSAMFFCFRALCV